MTTIRRFCGDDILGLTPLLMEQIAAHIDSDDQEKLSSYLKDIASGICFVAESPGNGLLGFCTAKIVPSSVKELPWPLSKYKSEDKTEEDKIEEDKIEESASYKCCVITHICVREHCTNIAKLLVERVDEFVEGDVLCLQIVSSPNNKKMLKGCGFDLHFEDCAANGECYRDLMKEVQNLDKTASWMQHKLQHELRYNQ